MIDDHWGREEVNVVDAEYHSYDDVEDKKKHITANTERRFQ
jgi:hypothetical protein